MTSSGQADTIEPSGTQAASYSQNDVTVILQYGSNDPILLVLLSEQKTKIIFKNRLPKIYKYLKNIHPLSSSTNEMCVSLVEGGGGECPIVTA